MGDFIAGGIVILVVGLAIYKMYRDKKEGKHCGGCSGCPSESNCKSSFTNHGGK